MKVLVIAWRELGAMLGSVVGWLVLCAHLVVTGFVFVLGVMSYLQYSEQVISAPYSPVRLTYADYLLWPFFSFQALFLLFLLPGVTMRLFSEEIRQQTLELLLTSPVSLWEIVLGKFVGALGFLTVMLLGTGWVAVFLLLWSDVDPAQLGLGYLAAWLAGATMIALGIVFSAATRHQVLALVLSEGLAFVLLLVSGLRDIDTTGFAGQLATTEHMEDLVRGVVRLSDVSYFVAFVAVCLLITQQLLAVRRWS